MFFLQFRDAAADTPIQEISSPLPLPVPRRGDEVDMHVYGEPWEAPMHVQRVRFVYQPGDPGPDDQPTMNLIARVWLSPAAV